MYNSKIIVPWTIPNFQKEDIDSMKRVLDSGWLSMGNEVKLFEKQVALFLNTKYAIATNNGTSALDIALKCIDIKMGDEVIVPAFTYIATANAVKYNRGTPVYADIDTTLNISSYSIEEKITSKTKAVITIDYGGNPSNYDKLLRITREHSVPLIVDGAQSLGSEYHNKKCCTHGLINTTSFHAAKILTTIEGGMLFTNNKLLCEKAQCIRNQGQKGRYNHIMLGNNYRMIDVVAGMGVSQIKRFKKTLEDRKKKVLYYRENLKNVTYPIELKNTKNCYFLFLIAVEKRDKFNRYLNRNGIETRVYKPLDNQCLAKQASEKIISLPLYCGITMEQQDYVIEKVNSFPNC
jgi:perosamine synthetase